MTAHAHAYGPTGTGTVVLDIGGDTGAVVIHTGPECHGLEIEVSEVRGAGRRPAPRIHAAVRERRLPGGVSYCALIAGLPAGEYTVWRDATTPAGSVTVRGGAVAEFRF
jgi:hypothetical protein